MKDFDDEIVVVVVEDCEHWVDKTQQVIKKEPEEYIEVSDLIEIAEKHGEYITIKEEPLDYDYISFLDYLQTDEVGERTKEYKILKRPRARKSFVKKLIRENPELRENRKLLVNTLEQIMRRVRPPSPPRDYYILNGISLECIKCGHISETLPAAGRHYQERHGERYLVCYACGVDFRSTTNLYKHEKICKARHIKTVLQARAAHLGNKGRSRPYLQRKKRIIEKKPPQRYPCRMCSADFSARYLLKYHENLHLGIRPYRCQQCTCAYTSHSGLLRHLKTHMDIQFICDHCKRSFKTKDSLVAHMDVHQPLRKHACEECDRRFAQKAALILHIDRVHRNLPPPCACQLCPKRYPRMSVLKEHMKKAHGTSIMTRKMFFKALPKMSDFELIQCNREMIKTFQ